MKKVLFLLFILLSSVDIGWAQNQSVSGKVVSSEDGEPIIGASIFVEGTKLGAASDADGRFTISGVPTSATKVRVSSVGMRTRIVSISRNMTIELEPDASQIDEVMVVAYGTTKKSSFTGSASVVNADQLGKINAGSFVGALQGMSSGVNVTNNEGEPGADSRIQIRGIGSMSGNTTPLYIVDGMPYDGTLTSINSTDIESMTILKDASASSLYGSRAANGVVVITTKKGAAGKVNVNFRAAWGTSDLAVPMGEKADPYQQLLNTWTAIYNDRVYNDGWDANRAGTYASEHVVGVTNNLRTNSAGEQVYVTPFKWPGAADKYVLHDGNGNPYANPDLQMVWSKDEWDQLSNVFSHKVRQDYGVDVSGATANNKVRYFNSLGYLYDKGYSNIDYYKRWTFRTNVIADITKNLQMGGSLAYTYARKTSSGYNRLLIFTNTLNSSYLRNADNTDWERSVKNGSKVLDVGENNASYFGMNPIRRGDYWNNTNDQDFDSDEFSTTVGQYYFNYKLPYDLNFRTSFNINDNVQHHYYYGSAVFGDGQMAPYGVTVKTEGGDASRTTYHTQSITWNNVLTWDHSFDKHHLNLMAGQEYYHYNQQYEYGYGGGIMSAGQFELSSTTKNWEVSSNRIRYALLSYFGKAEYNYDGRYYLSASFRTDGSSIFSKEKRWGTFYSVGGSWRISQEKFMEPTKSWLDNLSFRISYGTTGNDKLYIRNTNGTTGDRIWYGYQGYYEGDNLYGNAGYQPSSIATPDLKWESNKQFNVGLDFGIFQRLRGSIEYYSRSSTDLLYYRTLPFSAQVGTVSGVNTNIGDIRNSGFEFNLNYTPIQKKDLVWDINFNFSTLKNEVTDLPSGPLTYSIRTSSYRLQEGKSLYEFYMPKHAGVDPQTGLMQYWIRDGETGWKKTTNWSDVKESDYQWCGSAIPKAYGSITNNVRWKDFDFSMMWYASFGSKLFDYQYMEETTVRPGVGVVWDLIEGKYWTKPGDVAEFPRWSNDNASSTRRATDFYLFNNSFVRLRNVTLGYTLPRSLVSRIGLQTVRVYLTGDNLLTFGKAASNHTDPETGLTGNNYNASADTDSGYSSARRIYMAGIQITF